MLDGAFPSVDEIGMLLTGLLGDIPVAVGILDREVRFVYVNAAMAGLHGVPVVELTGRSLPRALPFIDGAVDAAIQAALGAGTTTPDIGVEGPSPDGDDGHWRMSVAPFRAAEGVIVGVSLVARDVTADIRAREARAQAEGRLLSLFSQQRDVAVELQRALLPSLLRHPAMESAARYVPGSQHLEVGGDWYDEIRLADDRIGIVIGDVMGKGLRAAALMGQVRAGLRAYARLDLDPAVALGHLDGVVQDLDEAAIVTCLYGIFDAGTATFTYASAGHLPPVLLADGRAVVLEASAGPPLGTGGEQRLASVPLPAGSTLALFTDGLVEDRTRGIDVGLEMLADAMACGPAGLEPLADHLLRAMGRDEGHDDDVALLLARPR